jgi:hypothetical protein
MMRAIIAVLAVATTAALAEPLPNPKPPGPGGSCPHGYTSSGSFCVPGQGAQDAIAKPRAAGAQPRRNPRRRLCRHNTAEGTGRKGAI